MPGPIRLDSLCSFLPSNQRTAEVGHGVPIVTSRPSDGPLRLPHLSSSTSTESERRSGPVVVECYKHSKVPERQPSVYKRVAIRLMHETEFHSIAICGPYFLLALTPTVQDFARQRSEKRTMAVSCAHRRLLRSTRPGRASLQRAFRI